MKFNNAIEIFLDNIVLLGNKEDFKMQGYDNKFIETCNWCYLKQEPNKLFCLNRRLITDPLYRDKLDKEIFNSFATKIDLKEEIYKELDRIIRNNMEIFIENNIDNISYLFENNEDNYENIYLCEIGIDLREKGYYGIDENICNILNTFKYKDIANAIIELSTKDGKKHFEFDMKKMKFENEEIDIFKNIYGLKSLKKILSFEQYKNGKTPPFYNEVAKINKFLEDKKTVTLLLNDGEKKKVPAQISQILARNHKKFWINTQLNNMDISNLRAIGYGRKELKINTDNLKSIDRQLDEIIENLKDKNLEIEELENEC